jgi:hypothetical protein
MEPAPVAAPDPILVSDDEEDTEEVNPEEGEPADQPNHEEQAPGEDLEDHHGPEVEEEEQDEAVEEVIWDVYHYRVDGVGISMADHLRAMVLRWAMIRPLFTIVSCGLTRGSSPIVRLRPFWRSTFHSMERGRSPTIMMWPTGPLWTLA